MATVYKLHPDNPQGRKVEAMAAALHQGALALYPTDTVYAIGCDLNHRGAVQRVRQLKQLANEKPLTFLCASLSNIADYAHVSDSAYRLIRRLIPGPFTFLLPATRQVPRLVMNPKRRTTGIRVPDHRVCLALIEALQNPVISTSALTLLPEVETGQAIDKMVMFDTLEKQVDIIVDDGQPLGYDVSTILDMEGEAPLVVRKGLGLKAALEQGAQFI
ncbi:threonylcarbamoyl-AMP synthase [Nodosilinea sp. LEGE 07088]|uniref:L-threonylcarbamoyladenylate synthase n=1 Tax=Nodosilinea sp. LEGE 07088 TaxID=2777968 RepID=UPI00187F442E|nr:L-threonylcarbamoyladenylate synthase [Nodosilinea sp. LEGE 07088]MBE9139258.1 threonylcarbamoyl-AMP synthase [Nodosilinea sp. LEGE 07088]